MSGQQPLRVIHVFRAPVGGLFRHVTDLATEQARCGHAVGVVCDASTGGGFEAATLAALRDKLALGLIRLPMQRQIGPSDLMAVGKVLGHLGRLAPDVSHGHGAKGGVYARLIGTWLGRRRPVARVYTPHGGSMHYDPAALNGRIYFAAERVLERLTDAIVHVSEFEAATYRAKVRAPRCIVRIIPNGLRPEEFAPVAVRPDARDLLFLGAFRRLKGIDVVLQAIAKLQTSEGLRVTANLVGQSRGRSTYEELANRLGIADRLAFHDPMNARDAFATSRAVVVPSLAESLPYVVLEAIAAGMPIVATRVGGIPEIFGPRAGELIPAGNADALAHAIKSLLSDPNRAQQDAAARREWLQPRFNVETMTREVISLYREILDVKAPHSTH
jgi:glycosyltransferase involved in cell wall biosynthesis